MGIDASRDERTTLVPWPVEARQRSREALTKLHPPALDDTVDISIAISNDISRDISKAILG
jgi:hypothetical protein